MSCKTSDVTGGTAVGSAACPSGFVFSDVTGGCRKQTAPSECVTVNCEVTMGNGVFSPYNNSKIYYALCTEKQIIKIEHTEIKLQGLENLFKTMKEQVIDEAVSELEGLEEFAATQYNILVFRCAKGAEFDRTPSISTCVYKCAKEGYLEYSLDNKMYYDCKAVGATGVLSKCPNDGTFDKDLGLCL